jgi:O-antigen/teichoic acid export membrane protein
VSLIRGSAVFSAIRIAGAGGSFVAQVILARLLTPHDLGIFFSATSTAAVTALLATQGYPQIAPRFVARYAGCGKERLLGAFIAQVTGGTARLALLATAGLGAAALWWPSFEPGARASFVIAAMMVSGARLHHHRRRLGQRDAPIQPRLPALTRWYGPPSSSC